MLHRGRGRGRGGGRGRGNSRFSTNETYYCSSEDMSVYSLSSSSSSSPSPISSSSSEAIIPPKKKPNIGLRDLPSRRVESELKETSRCSKDMMESESQSVYSISSSSSPSSPSPSSPSSSPFSPSSPSSSSCSEAMMIPPTKKPSVRSTGNVPTTLCAVKATPLLLVLL